MGDDDKTLWMRDVPEIVKLMARADTPMLTAVGKGPGLPPTPDYAKKTVTRHVEPYFGLWSQASGIFNRVSSRYEEIDDYFEPNESYQELEELVDQLELLAFEVVPNPEYDEERAKAWYEEHYPRTTTWVMGNQR